MTLICTRIRDVPGPFPSARALLYGEIFLRGGHDAMELPLHMWFFPIDKTGRYPIEP